MHVLITTTLGDITLALDQDKAPVSVANFLAYVDAGHYAGTIFHRVIDGFMVQGGGFTADMVQKPTKPPIVNEWRNGLKNKAGTVAMARVGGRPDSATCQFFINVKDNGFLDAPQPDGAAYAVFGRVVKGMEVVNAIRVAKTTRRSGMQDVPETPIEITAVRRLTDAEAGALA